MRHLFPREPAGDDTPVHVFGAGGGGRIVLEWLRARGRTVVGFIDDHTEGPVCGLPVLRTDAVPGLLGDAPRIVIASQHWRKIGRMLHALGAQDVFDASPVIRAANRLFEPTACFAEDIIALKAAFESVTDLRAEDVLAHLSPLHGAVHAALGGGEGAAPAARPVYIEGTGPAEKRLRGLEDEFRGLCVVGHVADVPPPAGWVYDVCTWDTLLSETDPAGAPLVILTSSAGEGRAATLRQAGFATAIWIPPAEVPEEGDTPGGRAWTLPERPRLSVVISARRPEDAARAVEAALSAQAWDVDCVLYDCPEQDRGTWFADPRVRLVEEDAELGAALRACRGDIIGLCPPGSTFLPDAMARAVECFRQHRTVGALFQDIAVEADSCVGPVVNLAEWIVSDHPAAIPPGFVRRRALDDIGAFEAAGSRQEDHALLIRLAMEVNARTAPLAVLRNEGALAVIEGAVALRRRFDAKAGAVRDLLASVEVLNGYHLLRQFCCAVNALLDAGQPPAEAFPILANAGITGPIAVPPLGRAAYALIANLYEQRAQVAQALVIFDAAANLHDIDLDALACQSALKLLDGTNEGLLRRQKRWAARHAALPTRAQAPRPDPAHRPLRIGYVCAYASAAYFTYQIIPFVEERDRSRFEAYFYIDQQTPAALRCADAVRVVATLSDADFRSLVQADGIDILVDVTGFGPNNLYRAFAGRCAPIQVSYANHAGTTACPNVDYILADEVSVTAGMEPFFTETVAKLPVSFFCFDFERDGFPPLVAPPVLTTGAVTFGCFGSGSKINDGQIALWSDVLHCVPESRLVLCNPSLSTQVNRRFMERRFSRHGIAPQRLWLHPGTDRETIKALYAEVDISFDTWPYCGGNTIAESVMSGVPVISLQGDTFAARYGASLLHACGLSDLVCQTPSEYVEAAARLAGDVTRLSALRTALPTMMRSHGLSDSRRFARKIGDLYETMMRDWCGTLERPLAATGPELHGST